MANWAKLQEQLTGLPVVKRARNSIHFDKGNGQVVANFSGKPCHYQDTDGLWKPIDTKLLLLPDGFYGSPHSDVKIHKDGRVKAGGYQQKSALVAAKEGVVDGDKIVREFKFGTQYLYMKEDGFRQETVITRPPTTAEAKYLIASESGELPSKYKRSDITAVDADGAVHEFVNLGQFKKWLDAAAYPVTIDPDFTSGMGDKAAYTYSTTSWLDAWDNTPGSENATGTNADIGCLTGWYDNRYLLLFDTSSIGAGGSVTQVNLKMRFNYGNSPTIEIAKFNWDGLTKAQWWSGLLTADADDSVWHTGSMSAGTVYTSGNLSTAWINKTGTTYYGIRTDYQRTGTDPLKNNYANIATANHATESYRPVLTVTYTTGGALRRINTSSFQQLTGGIHG